MLWSVWSCGGTFSSLSQPPLQSLSSVQNSSVVQSKTPSVVLEGLKLGTGYVVQVRARTVAGYGAYSKEMLFQTLTDGKVGRWEAGVCVCVCLCCKGFCGGD